MGLSWGREHGAFPPTWESSPMLGVGPPLFQRSSTTKNMVWSAILHSLAGGLAVREASGQGIHRGAVLRTAAKPRSSSSHNHGDRGCLPPQGSRSRLRAPRKITFGHHNDALNIKITTDAPLHHDVGTRLPQVHQRKERAELRHIFVNIYFIYLFGCYIALARPKGISALYRKDK